MNQEQQKHYEKCLALGTSPALAEMFATGRGPRIGMTDSIFWSGRWEEDSAALRHKRAAAKKAGVSTTGKFYMNQLADYPGDPKAWVSDRHDAQKICEERGWGAQGAVKAKATPEGMGQGAEIPGVTDGVADHIVEEEVQTAALGQPFSVKEKQDLREKIREKRKPSWARK